MMKNTSVRRALAWALVLVMTLSAVPVGVFAEEAEPVEKCLCTEKCTEDTRREDCPICAPEDVNLEEVCQGEEKQAEPQSAEAPVNEEAEKKAAEEAAARAEAEKKAAEEAAAKAEAEKKAAEEAAKAEAEKKAAKAEAEKKAAEEAAKAEAEKRAAEEAAKAEAEKKTTNEAALQSVSEDENTVTFVIKLRVDGEIPKEAWSVKLSTSFTFENAFERSGKAGEYPANDLTFTVPKNSSGAYYNAKFSVVIDGNTVDYGSIYVWENKENVVNFHRTTYDTTFMGNGLFKDCQGKVQNGKKILDAALEGYFRYKYDKVSINVRLSNSYSTDKNIYYLDAGVKEPDNSTEKNINGEGIDLLLPSLTGVYFIFTEDGEPISTNDQDTTYYVQTEDGLLLHNFQEGYYKILHYNDPVVITFDANGNGATVSQSKVTAEKNQTLDTSGISASRPGYHFLGWASNSNASAAETEIIPTEDMTLYAVWRKAVVTFDPNGGNVTPLSAELNDEQKLDSLPIPTRDGYIFDGWYRNQDGSGEKIDKDTIFEGDATVYAAWTPITYTVTFNGNGGTLRDSGAAVTEPVSVSYGANVDGPTFERENYTFNGWARNADGTDPVTDLNNLTTTDGASVTLYAQWTYDVRTVTFDAKGGTVSGEPTVTRMTRQNPANTLEELPIPDARKDYRFLGWYLSDGTKVTTETVFDKDTTVTARWFEAIIPDGVEVPDAFFDSDAMKDASGLEIRMEKSDNPAVKTLLELLKNYVQDNAGKDAANPLLNLSPEQLEEIDKNVVEMAVYPKKQDGQPYELKQTDTLLSFYIDLAQDWDKFENRELMVARIHEGALDFLNPSDGNGEGYSVDRINHLVKIHANKFSTYAVLAVPYTVHFDPNGGSMKAKDVLTGTDGKLTENLPDPGTRTGYTRNEDLNKVWKNGRNYVNQNTVYTANTTLVAQWTPITYKVTFNGNGGNVKNTLKTTDTVTVAYDVEITPATFVRDYYKLTGWAKNADGTEAMTTLKNLTTTQGEEITLYAQWEYVPRKVTFDVGEGFTVTKDGKDVRTVDVLTQEDPINTVKAKDIPVPNEREGWVFQGWYTEKDGKGSLVVPGGASKATVFKTDATVYAYWKEFEPVTVTLNAKGGTMRLNGKNVSSTTMETKWPGVLDGALPTPGRTNYKFLGWYTGAGIKVDEDTIFLRDTTIYARWQRAVSRTGNPKTGDQVRLGLAIGILAVAAVGLGAAVVIKKRKK